MGLLLSIFIVVIEANHVLTENIGIGVVSKIIECIIL